MLVCPASSVQAVQGNSNGRNSGLRTGRISCSCLIIVGSCRGSGISVASWSIRRTTSIERAAFAAETQSQDSEDNDKNDNDKNNNSGLTAVCLSATADFLAVDATVAPFVFLFLE